MNTKQWPWHLLQAFVACVDQGSISAAAASLGLSQPTLSRHIRELETKVQGRLFARSRQGQRPPLWPKGRKDGDGPPHRQSIHGDLLAA